MSVVTGEPWEVLVSITASEARRRLFPLIDEVNDDQMAVEIVSRSGTAYLVSADEYHALRETVHLLQSPRNAERLRESLDDLRTGRLIEKDIPAE
jgi:antitoxin YefM